MALLADASPIVAVHTLDLLQKMTSFPNTDHSAPRLSNKRLCTALLKKPAVVNPLVRFAVVNASETPASDLEWAAMTAIPLIDMLCSAEDPVLRYQHAAPHAEIRFGPGPLPPGGYVYHGPPHTSKLFKFSLKLGSQRREATLKSWQYWLLETGRLCTCMNTCLLA